MRVWSGLSHTLLVHLLPAFCASLSHLFLPSYLLCVLLLCPSTVLLHILSLRAHILSHRVPQAVSTCSYCRFQLQLLIFEHSYNHSSFSSPTTHFTANYTYFWAIPRVLTHFWLSPTTVELCQAFWHVHNHSHLFSSVFKHFHFHLFSIPKTHFRATTSYFRPFASVFSHHSSSLNKTSSFQPLDSHFHPFSTVCWLFTTVLGCEDPFWTLYCYSQQ